jgi:hypothetical protein
MSDAPITDAVLADFRGLHSQALFDSAHPQHGQLTEELTGLYARRYASPPAEIAAPQGSLTEFRAKHDLALHDTAHPDHAVRTAELTKIHERDVVGGNEPADSMMIPASSPADYDFSRVKHSVPYGSDLVPDAEFEQQARSWLHEGGVSPAEGNAIASIYAQSLTWSESDHHRISQATENGLRQKYGDDVGKVAAAAVKVARESGAFEFLESSGLINHWTVVNTLISRAEAKGYYKHERDIA